MRKPSPALPNSSRRDTRRNGRVSRKDARFSARSTAVEEAGRLLGISRSLAYELVNRGDIPSVRLGRRIVVPLRALDRLLDLPDDPA
jgi:excisionase family DNA binding protein